QGLPALGAADIRFRHAKIVIGSRGAKGQPRVAIADAWKASRDPLLRDRRIRYHRRRGLTRLRAGLRLGALFLRLFELVEEFIPGVQDVDENVLERVLLLLSSEEVWAELREL